MAELKLGGTSIISDASGTATLNAGVLLNSTFPAGHVIQTVTGFFDVPASVTATSTGTFLEFSPVFEKAITVTGTNKVLVSMVFNLSYTGTQALFAVYRDSTVIAKPNLTGTSNHLYAFAMSRHGTNASNAGMYDGTQDQKSLLFLDSPGSAGTYTYKLKTNQSSTYTGTNYLNRTSGNSDTQYNARTTSTILLQEISV
jgi:hypothetical protein